MKTVFVYTFLGETRVVADYTLHKDTSEVLSWSLSLADNLCYPKKSKYRQTIQNAKIVAIRNIATIQMHG